MIKIEEWLQRLDEVEDAEVKDNEAYQKQLFIKYLTNNEDHADESHALYQRFIKGEPLLGTKGLRKELAAIDLSYFGRAYFPHYFRRPSPQFHKELDRLWFYGVLKGQNPFHHAKKISGLDGCRRVVAAPRGHAKSTNLTFKDSLHAVLYQYKHYILILSDSSDQAEAFLTDIQSELEDNFHIIQDFGKLEGDKVWRTGTLLTKTNVKLEAIGSGKKLRGRKHRNWRPDLIILDDIENDENVNTSEQRRKLKSWFDKAVSKAGDTYTDIVYIGTVLHYDSLLSNVLKNASYDAQKYCAVISEAANTKLWEEWESIYTNLFDDARKENARTFYEANEVEMLKGTEVLWEEKLSYYKLMVMKVSEGVASFNSELQNEPIDPDNATFNLEWFDFYEPETVNFADPEYVFIGANDPSLGKNKKSDTSSIIGLAVSTKTRYMYVAEASVERRKPDVIIDDVIGTNQRLKRDYKKGFYKFGVETNQFQYFFKDVMVAKSREQGEYLPIEEIQSSVNKMLRIESLQPLIKNKYIKFNRAHKALLKQLEEYPMGKNDDAPDGLQMAVQLAQSMKGMTTKTDYKSIIKRRFGRKKGAY